MSELEELLRKFSEGKASPEEARKLERLLMSEYERHQREGDHAAQVLAGLLLMIVRSAIFYLEMRKKEKEGRDTQSTQSSRTLKGR